MNYNLDITLRELSDVDLYDGILVQSVGNQDHIFKLKRGDNGEWDNKVYAKIEGRDELVDSGGKDNGLLTIINIVNNEFRKSSETIWCETIYSRRMARDESLTQLGI